MDRAKAKQMLQQVDCHGIPRGFTGGYSELYKYCLESIEKLDKIEQIMEKYQYTLDNFYSGKPRDLLESDVLRDIKEVLAKE